MNVLCAKNRHKYKRFIANVSEKIFQIRSHAEMHCTSGQVVWSVAHIDPESIHFQANTPWKTGQTAIIVDRKFFFAQVIVPNPDTETFISPQQEFAVENKMPEKVIDPRITFFSGFFSK